jgi:hypothetical protein
MQLRPDIKGLTRPLWRLILTPAELRLQKNMLEYTLPASLGASTKLSKCRMIISAFREALLLNGPLATTNVAYRNGDARFQQADWVDTTRVDGTR